MGSTPPADPGEANLKGITATPSTLWTTGQYVQGTVAGANGQMYWNSAGWNQGIAP